MTGNARRKSTIKVRLFTPLIAAAGVAAAIVAAPPAAAVQCRDGGAVKVCQKPGHASLHAKPTPRSPNGSLFSNAWLPGYGRGHLPPLLALD